MRDTSTVHEFRGQWITNDEFCDLSPRNVFHRQLDKIKLDCSEHRDRHILFRRAFVCDQKPERAHMYLSADDCYKLYINGRFVAQGPAPAYHFRYCYNQIDVAPYLTAGENVIAVHTLYQGLINRLWQSGDRRHGLILDLVIDGETAVCSDESFLTAVHTAYREIGTVGYQTGFLEEYDSRAAEVGFERTDYDDSAWTHARIAKCADHTLTPQRTELTETEDVFPVIRETRGNVVFLDFGSNYVGTLSVRAKGHGGDVVSLRMGQELDESGCVRYKLRANCTYKETWILSDGVSELDPYDYKAFRYAELILPEGCELEGAVMKVRHYPFTLSAKLKDEYARDPDLTRIWELCVHTQKYGVQEAVLDCMEREKGFYLGDGCYTALTHMILTGRDDMVRKLIDDAFSADFITDGLVTCLNCSFMQEIAEYPLMLVKLLLWHYRLTGDLAYLRENYPKAVKLLDAYRRDYEQDGLLCDLDKWCVVEWPANFRDGYDVDIKEGQVCTEPHVSINAYYIEAIRVLNRIASALSLPPYRDETPLMQAFVAAFYDSEKQLFRDGAHTSHISLIGNVFPYAFGLCPDEMCRDNILHKITERGISAVSLFGAFLVLEGLVRNGREDLLADTLSHPGAWLRMLDEGATTTFEGWGKDTKWNTSLFHMTLSYAAVFLADIDLRRLLA